MSGTVYSLLIQQGLGAAMRLALAVLCLLPFTVSAQISNLHERIISVQALSESLDSLTIITPLISISDTVSGKLLPADLFVIRQNRLATDTLKLRQICPDCQTLRVRYRTLPYNLSAPVLRFDTSAIRRAGSDNAIEFDYSPFDAPSKVIEAPGIISNGTYTRGISLGNSQNLVFNSNLNLQLEGKLGNDLIIKAALSDNSVPLQPNGNTQQLQEFDRILVQIQRKNITLTAGDFDFTRPASGYFSNYFKRVQGGMVTYTPPPITAAKPGTLTPSVFSTPKKNTLPGSVQTRAGVGISRGKFARQIIQGQEGNQGPYRLQGAEGERFIIVLAGTEKVYIDGQLMRRGLDDDYVIDYNLGEVIFTSKRLITKDIRIIIEFEYAVQNYLRSTSVANIEWQQKRGKIWLNMYAEQDSRTPSGAQDLSDNDRFRLSQAGDSLRLAFASGIDTLLAFDPARVLYRAVDTVVCGVVQSVLEYSTNAEQARYAARFSEVPLGQGNYVQAPNGANGRVYKWVAPDLVSCQPSGNFEPIVRLIAPEQRQLHTIGAEYKIFKRTTIQSEAALSQRDINRFSPIGNNDNLGGGLFVQAQHTLFTQPKKGWQGQVNAAFETISATFVPLNPYRPAEFVRDWNIASTNLQATAERLIKGSMGMEKKNWGTLRYEYASFTRNGLYDGQKQVANLKMDRRNWQLLSEINLLQTNGNQESTRFFRPKAELSKSFLNTKKMPFLKIGIYTERERNARISALADTLSGNSFWYDLARIYVQMPEQDGKAHLNGYVSRRNDFAPTQAIFKQNTQADELNINGRLPLHTGKKKTPLLHGSIGGGGTYRQLKILAPQLTTQKAQNTFLGRLDFDLNGWKNALSFTTGYEVGSGQSPKVEFNYLRVNPGEGTYSWIDRNRDSILTLDEMEIAAFQDQATYARVAVSTSQYIRTNNVNLNQNLRIEPRLWYGANSTGWKKMAGRFSMQSTAQINRRVLSGVENVSPWNPFELSVVDSALVSVSSTLRNALFINRANPAWDMSLAQSENRSRILVTTGFESRQLADWTLHGRANMGQRWSMETDAIQGRKNNDTENFANRNFAITYWKLSPKLTWMPTRSLRCSGKFGWINSKNNTSTAEKAKQNDVLLEIAWNPQVKTIKNGFKPSTSLRTKFKIADIQYTGVPNTPVAFAMLEGLQNGRNLLWGLSLDRQLSKTMQINLSYEGRKTGDFGNIVHVGRAQIRAIF